jgi:hypothetical protein
MELEQETGMAGRYCRTDVELEQEGGMKQEGNEHGTGRTREAGMDLFGSSRVTETRRH